MAGGKKETPRQKMVGMMYLVLTALLALQVDNAVLEKFLFIDDSLQKASNIARDESHKIVTDIQHAVEERGNAVDDVLTLRQAKEVVIQTDEVITEIEEIRNSIIDATGGKDEDGNYKGASAYDEVMQIAIGPQGSKSGRAYKLQELLNAYTYNISQYDSALSIAPIALDAKDTPQFANNEIHKNKDFSELNFGNTPTVAALAILNQLKSEVSYIETRALKVMAKRIGATEPVFNRIVAVVSPEAKVVPLGSPYKAKMFIAASTVGSPEMEASTGKVEVNEEGEGFVEFIAKANNFDDKGRSKQVWRGSITIPTPKGDTTFMVEEEYYVAKPTMQVSSASVQALYYNCGNELNVQVPELGNEYNPEFSVKGGSYTKGNKTGIVTIVPKEGSVELSVKNKGYFIGSQKYRVKPVPLPTIKLANGNRALNLKDGGRVPRSLKVKAIPDQDFAEFLPSDARYKVSKWEVTLARGNRAIGGTKKLTSESVNLNDFAQSARDGDRLVIEVREVVRKNYQNNIERVPVKDIIYTYPIIQ